MGDVYIDQLNIQPFLTIPVCLALLVGETVLFACLAYFALVATSRRVKSKVTPQLPSGGTANARTSTA